MQDKITLAAAQVAAINHFVASKVKDFGWPTESAWAEARLRMPELFANTIQNPTPGEKALMKAIESEPTNYDLMVSFLGKVAARQKQTGEDYDSAWRFVHEEERLARQAAAREALLKAQQPPAAPVPPVKPHPFAANEHFANSGVLMISPSFPCRYR